MSPKNRKPLQCEPVTALATAEREPYTAPAYSNPLESTLTWMVLPLYFRVRTKPGGGSRSSYFSWGSVPLWVPPRTKGSTAGSTR